MGIHGVSFDPILRTGMHGFVVPSARVVACTAGLHHRAGMWP